jgi:hypothetical protein
MNLGLRDVASLADAIASKESFRNLGDTVLLRRYERAPRGHPRADGRDRRAAAAVLGARPAREGGAQRGHGVRRRAAAREALAGVGRARLIEPSHGGPVGQVPVTAYTVTCTSIELKDQPDEKNDPHRLAGARRHDGDAWLYRAGRPNHRQAESHAAARLGSDAPIKSVSKSPVAGLYEVNLGSQIIYSDAAGDYVLLGDLVDTKTHKNLTDARLSDLN